MVKRDPSMPSCIVDGPGIHTLCGRRRETVPITAAQWVRAHIDGRQADLCLECRIAWTRTPHAHPAGQTSLW